VGITDRLLLSNVCLGFEIAYTQDDAHSIAKRALDGPDSKFLANAQA
jgi:hypothetical protein